MAEIVPAIIPKSFADLDEKVSALKSTAELVQVDVCDGKFVPNRSWPFIGDNGEFRKIVAEKDSLPRWKDLDYEAHILAETPTNEVADWIRAGAARVFVHIETGSDEVENIIEEWGHLAEIGIAIGYNTSLSMLAPFISKVSTFLLMSISEAGFQGHKFENGTFERIRELRKFAPKHIIAVDGGVNLENVPKLLESGADKLIVGSAIFGQGIPSRNLKLFQSIINDRH